jgi:hypothetical protein
MLRAICSLRSVQSVLSALAVNPPMPLQNVPLEQAVQVCDVMPARSLRRQSESATRTVTLRKYTAPLILHRQFP